MTTQIGLASAYVRAFERYPVTLWAHAIQDGFEIPCTVRDISAGGARLSIDPVARSSFRALGFQLCIDGLGTYPSTQRWKDRQSLGVEFDLSHSVRAALERQLAERFSSGVPWVNSGG
ncbi:PilZ domain-containing protein [Ponticoccus alexandrii]|uniref:PilZ domain-containing protein n=1 Tax=Ponticoccus alexandrii TaxID=1943633 RepID=A0ABX7FB46_9RHOB|nr:PilZ domain-containing protein [Ponticoccus alexandrii]ETA53059.1 hypothetical protein P279_05330 [Rhodobacteraceae bacterium PD-2]QRF66774.1 hypothetical protein GQA70_10920 [Ponticoccus alexandrii]